MCVYGKKGPAWARCWVVFVWKGHKRRCCHCGVPRTNEKRDTTPAMRTHDPVVCRELIDRAVSNCYCCNLKTCCDCWTRSVYFAYGSGSVCSQNNIQIITQLICVLLFGADVPRCEADRVGFATIFNNRATAFEIVVVFFFFGAFWKVFVTFLEVLWQKLNF